MTNGFPARFLAEVVENPLPKTRVCAPKVQQASALLSGAQPNHSIDFLITRLEDLRP